MARVFCGFAKRERVELVAREPQPEPADFELQIRSLYDSSWMLRQGLLVIEEPPADWWPEEWVLFG